MATTPTTSGARVDRLYRYPVKSMLGEEIGETAVGERGLTGDRGYALIDRETGKVVSAKNPRRWSVLFQCRAAFVEEPRTGTDLPPVRITFPDGRQMESDDDAINAAVSGVVGRDVRLETQPPDGAVYESLAPVVAGINDADEERISDEPVGIVAPGTFFDAAPLHVVTTASLARLHELAPGSRFPVERFRPNVLVALDGEAGFVENAWVNRSLTFGGVGVSVFLSAPRCVMTTLAQPDLPRDPAVLQTIARHNRFDIPGLGQSSCVGVYALVTTAGTTRKGDTVEIA